MAANLKDFVLTNSKGEEVFKLVHLLCLLELNLYFLRTFWISITVVFVIWIWISNLNFNVWIAQGIVNNIEIII